MKERLWRWLTGRVMNWRWWSKRSRKKDSSRWIHYRKLFRMKCLCCKTLLETWKSIERNKTKSFKIFWESNALKSLSLPKMRKLTEKRTKPGLSSWWKKQCIESNSRSTKKNARDRSLKSKYCWSLSSSARTCHICRILTII